MGCSNSSSNREFHSYKHIHQENRNISKRKSELKGSKGKKIIKNPAEIREIKNRKQWERLTN